VTHVCPHCGGETEDTGTGQLHATYCRQVTKLNADLESGEFHTAETGDHDDKGRPIPAGTKLMNVQQMVDRLGVIATLHVLYRSGFRDEALTMLRQAGVEDIDIEAALIAIEERP
jgi:hypothetical protein